MHDHRRLVASAGLALALTAPLTPAEEHRQLGPHVHGVGHLDVALDGATLAIELDSPAANLVGFEHPPRDAAEQARFDATLAALRDGGALFLLPAAAGCRLEAAQVGEEAVDHDGDAGEPHEGEEEHHHADINGSYRFLCDRPEALDALDVGLFERFPATKRLEVQLIGPHGQRGGELTAEHHRLDL
ncbi:DUF2796 domain-containing protein [Endothiovibrio diazotrophicus]